MIEGTAKLQRALTVEFITKRRLNLPAVWFRPNAGDPSAADALADDLSVDLESWDGPEHNLGVRLQDGHLELAIKAGDDAFVHAFFLAADHLRSTPAPRSGFIRFPQSSSTSRTRS